MRRTVTEEHLLAAQAPSQEFQYALDYLADKPDGSKLSRKRPIDGQATQYSYIKIEGEVYQITHLQLGRGTYSKAKLAYNSQGERFALKISTDQNANLAEEEAIERDLGVFQAGAQRSALMRGGLEYTKHLRLMPYLGKNLVNYLAPEWFSPHQVLNIILQCMQEVIDFHAGRRSASGTSYLHRDIKPNNFVMDRERFQVKLIDFGFALPKDQEATDRYRVLGTRGYMAPEVYAGEYSVATDIYALGVSVTEILEYSGVDSPVIQSLANLMSSDHPLLRPYLEFAKIALLVYQARGASFERLAVLLAEQQCLVIDPELAVKMAVILLNATSSNHFSDAENFEKLIDHPKINYLVEKIWAQSGLREFIFSALINVNKIDELFFAFQNLELSGQLNQQNLSMVLNYPDFAKLLSCPEGEFFDVSNLVCELVKRGDLQLIKKLMTDQRASFSALAGKNPLEIAIKSDHLRVITYLLSKQNPQCEVIKSSDYFCSGSALAWAVAHERWHVAAGLIIAGSPGDCYMQVILALIKQREINLTRDLLEFSPMHLNAIDQRFSGKTVLMEAALRGDDELVLCLLELGADLDALDQHNNTALFYALNHNHLETAKLLLAANADPNIKGRYDFSPLMLCLADGKFEMLAYLLLHAAELDIKARPLFKKYKSEIEHALVNLLSSGEVEDPVLKQKALYLLKRMAVVKNSGVEADLFLEFFGGDRCFCLFKSSSYTAFQRLAERFLDAEREDQASLAVVPG